MEFTSGQPIPEGLGYGGMEAGSGMPALPGFGHYQSWQELAKAVTAGDYVTEPASMAGGRAMQKQSLEATLIAILQNPNDFALFNKLNKTQAGAIVDEFSVVDDTGMWPGAAVNTELGEINESTGHYQRYILQIKYLMDRRRVSVVQDTVPNKIASATATEQMLSTLGLLTSIEWLLFNGNADVIPAEFNGIEQIINAAFPSHVIDARGGSIDAHGAEIVHASEQIAATGTYGKASDVFWSNAIQADVDQGLAPAVRVPLPNYPNGGVLLGSPVSGVRSSFAYNGGVVANADRFIQEGGQPFALRYPNASMGSNAPGTPVLTEVEVDAGVDAPLWETIDCDGGTYVYGVEAINLHGRSAMAVHAATAPTEGKSMKLTITSNADSTGDKKTTGYALYRGPRNGAAGTNNSNLREFKRIPANAAAGAQATVYQDKNEDLPGSSKAYVLNLTPGMQAMDIRRLAPLTRFNLYPTTRLEIPWAQFIFLALRMMKPGQHQIIKNLVPKQQSWKPR